jgi:phosphatidate cytidylyltransferase
MAFNWQTFRTRTLSAIIFAGVMIVGILWNPWSFFILFSIIHFGCWNEYQKIVAKIDAGYSKITPFHKYGVMIAGWCIMLYFTPDACRISGFPLHELGWWLGLIFLFVLPILELLMADHIILKNIGHSAFGLLYISLSLGLMIDLGGFANNKPFDYSNVLFPCLIIAALWINDTMAYIVGSLIGKTSLTAISPKKTWEGTLGGIVLCIVAAGFLFSLTPVKIASYHWYLIAGIIAITGTIGDLLESKLKRMSGVKDSGAMMPGHGGFMDRFDSMLLAIPFTWIYVQLFIR